MLQLTDQGVYFILSKRREQAKVAEFTPHDMRRSFAGDLLDAGTDISMVQKLMRVSARFLPYIYARISLVPLDASLPAHASAQIDSAGKI